MEPVVFSSVGEGMRRALGAEATPQRLTRLAAVGFEGALVGLGGKGTVTMEGDPGAPDARFVITWS